MNAELIREPFRARAAMPDTRLSTRIYDLAARFPWLALFLNPIRWSLERRGL